MLGIEALGSLFLASLLGSIAETSVSFQDPELPRLKVASRLRGPRLEHKF